MIDALLLIKVIFMLVEVDSLLLKLAYMRSDVFNLISTFMLLAVAKNRQTSIYVSPFTVT